MQMARLMLKDNPPRLELNLSRFSDTLEELKLENEILTDSVVKSMKSLKKLKVLSLPSSIINCECVFLDTLSSMTQLR